MREQYETKQAAYDSPKTATRDTPTQEQAALLEKTRFITSRGGWSN